MDIVRFSKYTVFRNGRRELGLDDIYIMNSFTIGLRWLKFILQPNYSIDSQESYFMEFNLAIVYLVGEQLRKR